MLTIKVLGSGCEAAIRLQSLAHQAVDIIGVKAEIRMISSGLESMQYDVSSTPGLMINGRLVSTCRIPGVVEIITWLVDAELRGS